MTEPQTPFVHQDGTTTPADVMQLGKLLIPHSLAGQVGALDDQIHYCEVGLGALREDGGDPAQIDAEQEIIDELKRARSVLLELQAPTLNAAASAIVLLPPADAALIGEIATAILGAGNRRPKLLLALRAAMESAS
jgi:hypothetical protein